MSEQSSAPGLLLCDDLMFSSRITGTARSLGFEFRQTRSIDALMGLVETQKPPCVIVDLSLVGAGIQEFIRRVEGASAPRPRLIAYGSHVDAATLQAARQAGCAVVLPRSKFVEQLPQALPEWMAQP